VRDTQWGRGWLVGAMGVVLAAIGFVVAKGANAGWFVAGVGAVAIAFGEALTGHAGATSVPSVRPGAPDPRWNSGGTPPNASAAPQGGGYGGGSFLGTAAASAAGMIGGALLLNSISSMFGHHGGSAFAAVPQGGSPWDNNASGSDLARDAGLNDIGSGGRDGSQHAALFGNDDDAELVDDLGDDASGDFGGDFGGGDSA
jgi:hypothetical protein